MNRQKNHSGHHFERHGFRKDRSARGERHGGPDGDFHRGRVKRFRRDELRLMVLGILSETGPHHGYDLIGKFSERSGEAYAPSPGVLYPLLTMLAEMDLIEETEAGGNKREYRIADAGRAQIEKDRENLDAAFARLDTLRTHARRTNAGPVRRAMGNLRTAAMQRLSAENADEELTFAVAAILDEAAQKIERL